MADEPISDSEKVKIASNLILHAPPGEFNEVFNDVRIIIDNDSLLKEGASWSFAQYNKDQFTPCKLEGASEQVLITEHGEVRPNYFIDPKTKQSFRYDHLRKEASDAEVIEPNASEPWRSALEKAMSEYIKEYYQHGVVTVYGSVADGNITLIACTESHKFEPHNFWNGRWRSQWSVTFPESGGNAELVGILKVQVHYYEDGNVQLVSSKEAREQVTISSESKLAKDVCKLLLEAEQNYQQAINDNYREMSGTTFKALRRQLPVTRSKVDWNKIAGYGMVNALKMP